MGAQESPMEVRAQRTGHGRWMTPEGRPRLVSTVIPTHNRGRLIVETLESLYEQTYRPMEILIADDGSTDDTAGRVAAWSREHHRPGSFEVRYLPQENCGAPAARNLGLVESRGAFIQFLDSDDLVGSRKIEREVEWLRTRRPGTAAYAGWRYFASTPAGIDVYGELPALVESDALRQWIAMEAFVPPHAVLWFREDCTALGPWDETLAADQDGDYMLRFLLRGGTLTRCPEAWVYYRTYTNHAGGIRTSRNKRTFEARVAVTRRVEECLRARGQHTAYSAALAVRYAILARRSARYHPRMTTYCLKRSRGLAPEGAHPDLPHMSPLDRLLGLSLRVKLGALLHEGLGIPRRRARHSALEVIARVRDTPALCRFDEPRDGEAAP